MLPLSLAVLSLSFSGPLSLSLSCIWIAARYRGRSFVTGCDYTTSDCSGGCYDGRGRPGVSDQAALAEVVTVRAATVVGSGGSDGGSVVLAGYGQGTKTPGAVESRDDVGASGRSEAAASVEERTTEGHSGGGLDLVVEETEASPVREPRTDLGKAPIVEDESVVEPGVEPVVEDTPPLFVGSGVGAGSSRPVGMGDYLATTSMEDVFGVGAGYWVGDALLGPERQLAGSGLGPGVREPEHVVVPSLFDPYTPRRPTYDEALVLRDPQRHLSLRRDEEAAAFQMSDLGHGEGEGDVAKYAQLLRFWTERLPTGRRRSRWRGASVVLTRCVSVSQAQPGTPFASPASRDVGRSPRLGRCSIRDVLRLHGLFVSRSE
ncbi:hypothetical protein RHMOL_Rhmol09G0116300 [Rhododendron molle]|uniref:Uncharacterized protein n=1 Tax=Rhododendron molle TaxID=49168 RepID=A0ACC0MC11_RHOML|nr:hypothetical protein RHMOL_Rhmol09G0116300 [Rhododendron molle]